jgi:SAM-dependent methyltransferase
VQFGLRTAPSPGFAGYSPDFAGERRVVHGSDSVQPPPPASPGTPPTSRGRDGYLHLPPASPGTPPTSRGRDGYVHGYDQRENLRLQDQASSLVELLHADTAYPEGSSVLEAGCGVGAQTVSLASNSPKALITSIDISEASLAVAGAAVQAAGIGNVSLRQADIFHLPFASESFDHVFVCFVLEHLAQPVEALRALTDVLKPGGTITVIEGDHGSTFFYPDSEHAHRAIQCQVDLQAREGGNALIGRALYPLLRTAGFGEVHVSPRMVYVDSSKPDLVEGFTKRTFTAMIEGIRTSALESKIISEADFDDGIAGLYRTAEADGVFCYTFFKATAVKASPPGRRSHVGLRSGG